MAHNGYISDDKTPINFFWQEPVEVESEVENPFDKNEGEYETFLRSMKFENTKAGRIAKRVRYLHFIIPRTDGTECKYNESGFRPWYENSDPVYMKLVAPIRAKAKADSDAFWADRIW